MRTWIFPNSPKAYEPQDDFDTIGRVDWYQNRKVEPGDIAYIYRSTPIKRICWKCKIGRVGYYMRVDDEDTFSYTQTEEYSEGPYFEVIPLIGFEPMEELSFAALKRNGLKSSLMGPQTIQDDLIEYLESVEDKLQNSEVYETYAATLPIEKLRALAVNQGKKEVKITCSGTKQFARSSCVAQYAKARAKGICQLCGKPAPFTDREGKPYLESHHIVWLSRGGADTIENVAALCPNCHKKMHILDLPGDVEQLLKTVKEQG